MNDDEIRAEIERRMQRAKDLKIKEVLWSLHNYFQFHNKWKADGPPHASSPKMFVSKNSSGP